MHRQRVENIDLVIAEMLPIAQVNWRSIRHHGKRNPLPESFKTHEDKIPVLLDRAARRPAKLVADVFTPRRSHQIILRVVGIKNRVANEIEQRPMHRIGTGLQRCIYAASARAPCPSIIAVGLHFEFLNGVNIGSHLPTSRQTNRSPIQAETVRSSHAAPHRIATVGIPTPRA